MRVPDRGTSAPHDQTSRSGAECLRAPVRNDFRSIRPGGSAKSAATMFPSCRDPTDEELARDWQLSEQDLVEVRRCRSDDNRHSFAIQLCTLRAYGRFLGQDYGSVPIRIVNHVGRQLGMPPVFSRRRRRANKPTPNMSVAFASISAFARSTTLLVARTCALAPRPSCRRNACR